MKKMHIANGILSLSLVGAITLTGCTKLKKEEPPVITTSTRTVETKYDIEAGTKEYIIEKTITDGENSETTFSTITKPMELCEYKTTNIISKEEINLRMEPNENSEIIKIIPEGSVLQSVYNDGEWYRVFVNDEIGYVKSEYVYEEVDKNGYEIEKETINRDNLEIEKTTYVEAIESVNIRSDATAESNQLGLLEVGQKKEALKLLNNGWYEINYNGNRAYVKGDYVKEVTEEKILSPFIKKVMFTNDSNIYTSKDRNEVADVVPTYEVGYVYSEIDDMYIADVNDRLVYINKYDTMELPSKLVIVDLSDQNAKLWDENNLIVDTPVVTGKQSTPTYEGYFEIYDKERNAVLQGKYFVDYWMPFDEGRGLHDAEHHEEYDEYGNVIHNHGWRYSDEFGTDAYQWAGSHGCVNMLNNAAKTVYENTEVGTKVLVKK